MQITDIKVHRLAIPFDRNTVPSAWPNADLPQVIVEICTDEGATGYGEAFSLGLGLAQTVTTIIEHMLKPLLIGADPRAISYLQQLMLKETHIVGRYGAIVSAISGVDIALWDLAGKLANRPLCYLLGGAQAEHLPVYTSLFHYEDPEELDSTLHRALATGVSAVKLHQTDVGSVRVARETIGPDIGLMVDVNCPWTPAVAKQMALKFKEFNLSWLEEPIWPPEDFQSLAKLRQETGVPIALGENAYTVYQYKAMLDAGAGDVIQPSVAKLGGITEWLKVASLCQAYNVGLAPHSFYFGPGFLATAHLVASTPGCGLLERMFAQPEVSVYKGSLTFVDGGLQLPNGPGLGLEIDNNILKEYAVV